MGSATTVAVEYTQTQGMRWKHVRSMVHLLHKLVIERAIVSSPVQRIRERRGEGSAESGLGAGITVTSHASDRVIGVSVVVFYVHATLRLGNTGGSHWCDMDVESWELEWESREIHRG